MLAIFLVTFARVVLADSLCQECDNKLNAQTKEYLEKATDATLEERDYLIQFSDRINDDSLKNLAVREKHDTLKVVHVKGTAKEIEKILNMEHIVYVELDQPLILLADTIPFGVNQTGAPTVWNTTTGSGVKVAILDTGIASHPDLNIAGGYSVVGSNYTDYQGHGTAVAGVVAATINDDGLVGVSPDVDLYAVKIMEGQNGNLSNAIAGLDWALENNMRIVIMSFGQEEYSQIFRDALNQAYQQGILLIAATGNDGENRVLYPAAYSTVIAVGAVDEQDDRASFSNYGPELELVAQGVNISTTTLNGGYVVVSGTSVAAPHVAGVVALLLAVNGSLTNEQLRAKLDANALDLGAAGKDDEYGYGLVHVNLTFSTYNVTPLNYHYEIFNITDYDLPNETRVFWLNGTGTIDDVNFSPGYYQVNRTFNGLVSSYVLNVSENGVIRSLYAGMNWDDEWAFDGSYTDGIVWIGNDVAGFTYEDSSSDADVMCANYENDGYYDYCWALNSAALNACEAADSWIQDMCNAGLCSSSGLYSWHSLPTGSFGSKARRYFGTATWYNCDGSMTSWGSSFPYYGIDHKKTACGSSSSFQIKGQYSSTGWVTIDTYGCGTGKQCDSAIAGNYTASTANYDFRSGSNYPCRVANGYACNATSDCLTGLTCSGGICSSENSTDLQIINVIPIQVVPNVPMVQGKSGYVIVSVWNNGSSQATATVSLTLDGSPLSITSKAIPAVTLGSTWFNQSFVTGINSSSLAANQTKWFVFDFKPPTFGNRTLNASVVTS